MVTFLLFFHENKIKISKYAIEILKETIKRNTPKFSKNVEKILQKLYSNIKRSLKKF